MGRETSCDTFACSSVHAAPGQPFHTASDVFAMKVSQMSQILQAQASLADWSPLMTGKLWLQLLPCHSGATILFQRQWWLLGGSLATICPPWTFQTSSWFLVSPRLQGKLVCTQHPADSHSQLACTVVFHLEP